MVTQPEALRFADALEATDQMHSNADLTSAEVAAELRRLHSLNQELLNALDRMYITCDWHTDDGREAKAYAYALMEKATGENK